MTLFQSEYVELRDLLERSSDAINHQDWACLAAMMTEDVVWERKPPIPWTLNGRDEVSAFLAGNLTKLTILHYEISASAIQIVDAQRATCRSTMSELIRLQETETILRVVGTYNDALLKSGGMWRFIRRTISPRFEQDVVGSFRTFCSDVVSPLK